MILFQANFYTDVFGLSTGVAGTIVLVARLWDAVFDPIMGVLADRTQTRWGSFVHGCFGLRFPGRSSWFSLTRRLTLGSQP